MYSVYLSQDSQKFLDKLDKSIKERIETKLKSLANNPVPSDSKFINRDENNEKIFRFRICDYRALYKLK